MAATFVDGMGVATATSGILSELQGRIFALLYIEARPMSLDEIAAELQQSKSNISITIRGAVEWHLVRRVSVPGSRKDHYEAATDFWRVMQEIMERRIRWTSRQVMATIDETKRMDAEGRKREAKAIEFTASRLDALRAFFAAIDENITALTQGGTFNPPVPHMPVPSRLVLPDDA